MKLLLDANISWRLVKKLAGVVPNVLHVNDSGLPMPAKDEEIWSWALHNDFVIVTNDEDFLNFSLLKGFPPKVILLRKGNLSTNEVAALLISCYHDIEIFCNAPADGVLEIF
ncbi:MAG: DUF5615 family PIN-like protein [Thermaurantimonas sp.]|uniref:DUF5615 family PIN-like protein n=1 Tax=Thermaurantimonas sp. TaxID=2681568 RepID=UPI00391BD33E